MIIIFFVCLCYFIKHFCLNFTYTLLVVAKLHLHLVFVHFHSQADSPNNPPLPQTFLHPQKAQHNPQNLEIYRLQCNQNQPIFHVLTFYFNKFHITHAYQFIYKYMYIYRVHVYGSKKIIQSLQRLLSTDSTVQDAWLQYNMYN